MQVEEKEQPGCLRNALDLGGIALEILYENMASGVVRGRLRFAREVISFIKAVAELVLGPEDYRARRRIWQERIKPQLEQLDLAHRRDEYGVIHGRWTYPSSLIADVTQVLKYRKTPSMTELAFLRLNWNPWGQNVVELPLYIYPLYPSDYAWFNRQFLERLAHPDISLPLQPEFKEFGLETKTGWQYHRAKTILPHTEIEWTFSDGRLGSTLLIVSFDFGRNNNSP